MQEFEKNLRALPINDFNFVNSSGTCPEGYFVDELMNFEGTEEGCDIAGKITKGPCGIDILDNVNDENAIAPMDQ